MASTANCKAVIVPKLSSLRAASEFVGMGEEFSMNIKARFEFKIEDSWIGVFWKRTQGKYMDAGSTEGKGDGPGSQLASYFSGVTRPHVYDRLDIWICVVPWIPFHIVATWGKQKMPEDEYLSDILS